MDENKNQELESIEAPKEIIAESWYQFTQWFPEINPKLINNFELESIEIKVKGARFYFKNENI